MCGNKYIYLMYATYRIYTTYTYNCIPILSYPITSIKSYEYEKQSYKRQLFGTDLTSFFRLCVNSTEPAAHHTFLCLKLK